MPLISSDEALALISRIWAMPGRPRHARPQEHTLSGFGAIDAAYVRGDPIGATDRATQLRDELITSIARKLYDEGFFDTTCDFDPLTRVYRFKVHFDFLHHSPRVAADAPRYRPPSVRAETPAEVSDPGGFDGET